MSDFEQKRGVSPLPSTGLIKGNHLKTAPSGSKRKLEITEEILENFEWWGKMNYQYSQMCSRLKISVSRLHELMKEDCRIKEAIECGRNDVYDMLVKAAYRDAQKDGKVAIQILKAKYDWSPTTTQHMIIEQEPDANQIPEKLSDDPVEASRAYQKLMG